MGCGKFRGFKSVENLDRHAVMDSRQLLIDIYRLLPADGFLD